MLTNVGSASSEDQTVPGTAMDVTRVASELSAGARLGRYAILESIGAGAMGSVYAAYDPQLDRKIALKALTAAPYGSDGSGVRDEVLREARALARLAHPNVVAVHEVDQVDGIAFIAMEFADGQTLAEWSATRRPWRGVVRVLCAAAEGLAAAHEAGIIHGDFKPSNVIVDEDGRTKVIDFGLARSVGDAATSGSSLDEGDAWRSDGDTAGTPAYMAPERFAGSPRSACADQFSFCVTAHEALVGWHPFEGETANQLAASISDGRMRKPPRDPGIPRWLLAVLIRGLAALGRRPRACAHVGDPRASGIGVGPAGLVRVTAPRTRARRHRHRHAHTHRETKVAHHPRQRPQDHRPLHRSTPAGALHILET
jgi:serine/threonine protein kinase